MPLFNIGKLHKQNTKAANTVYSRRVYFHTFCEDHLAEFVKMLLHKFCLISSKTKLPVPDATNYEYIDEIHYINKPVNVIKQSKLNLILKNRKRNDC